MSFWIFAVIQQRSDGRIFEAEEVLRQRFEERFWGLGERTPNRRLLRKGDQIVFYLGSPLKTFGAEATLASDGFKLTPAQITSYAHGTKIYEVEYGVLLDNCQIWQQPRAIDGLLADLRFIENKEYWMVYLQGGVRQIGEADFRLIIDGRASRPPERKAAPKDIENDSQFALESHLEEFIDQNWNRISFGADLAKYRTEDQSGRQFPAGAWSVDFLCTDRSTGDFVVVELKRGRTSDATVGQLLRYMSWIKEHVADPSQNVRGIIIAREIDEALRISVLTYRVNFELTPLGDSATPFGGVATRTPR